MPCSFTFSWADIGNTVPYPPFRGGKRNNRGFSDLRGRPKDAATIAECCDSEELKHWLSALAEAGSPIFSLGCDIGSYRRRKTVRHQYATGGYVQLLAADYASRDVADYKALAERLATPVRLAAEPEDWEAAFLLQTVQLNLDDYGDEVISLCVEFNAWADSAAAAKASRERLVLTLRQACCCDAVFGNAPT